MLITGSATDPCPQCGSLNHTITVNFTDKLGITGSVDVSQGNHLSDARGTVVNPATVTVKASFPQGSITIVDPRPILGLGELEIRMAFIDNEMYQVSIGDEVLEPFGDFEDALMDLIILIKERYYGG